MNEQVNPVAIRLEQLGLSYDAEQIAAAHHVTVDAMLGDAGKPNRVVAARHAFWLLVRERTRYSYPELAALFGPDQSTIRSGCEKAKRQPA